MGARSFVGVIIFVVAIVIAGLITLFSIQPGENFGFEASQEIAREWIINSSPTYNFDGSELNVLRSDKIDCSDCFEFEFSFQSANSGYGENRGDFLAQVIVPHVIVLEVEKGVVVRAITDGKFNEVAGEFLSGQEDQTMEILLYFNSDEPNGECEKTIPIKRIVPRTLSIARTIIGELLSGPTEREMAEGYLTSINEGVRINRLVIEDGVAKIDFNKELDEGVGGSCRVAAIRSQIENSLKQISSISEVIISVEGNVEEALQP